MRSGTGLGVRAWKPVWPHHAGLIPAFREAVEDCFAGGLLLVVFATETLSLGINMPARTVVIERLTKQRDQGRTGLTSGDYAQLTGRAGRRGLDSMGNAVTLWRSQMSLAQVAALATSPAPALSSSFRPTYNLATNIVRRYPADEAHYVLDRSFAQFLDTAHHHSLSRRLDRAIGLLEKWRYLELDAWKLTSRGELLARLYHESDLLTAEALSEGIFDGLDTPTLAAVVSGCTFEARKGRAAGRAPAPAGGSAPPGRLVGALGASAHGGGRCTPLGDEGARPGVRRAGVALGRGELVRVLERAELAAGDFVRNAKQLVDLLSQIAILAPDPSTGAVAALAAKGSAGGWSRPRCGLPQSGLWRTRRTKHWRPRGRRAAALVGRGPPWRTGPGRSVAGACCPTPRRASARPSRSCSGGTSRTWTGPCSL